MNLGNIPGYYFDEEKKKYFKVAPNNAVEAAQRYTKANISHEKKANRKRKFDERWAKKREGQTIKRSPLLTLPQLAGYGLHREIGLRPHVTDQRQADEAFISRLRYKSVIELPWGIAVSAFPMPSINRTLLAELNSAIIHNAHQTNVVDVAGDFTNSSYVPDPYLLNTSNRVASLWELSQSVSVWPAKDPKMLFAGSGGGGQIYIGSLDYEAATQPSAYLTMGTDETLFFDSAFCPDGESIAVASTSGIAHMGVNVPYPTSVLNNAEDRPSRAIDWLNPRTIAAGSGNNTVLWDIRNPLEHGSTASRFSSESTITGLRTVPNSDGTQLLVSTNRNIALFDTRKGSSPLLQFRNRHDTPRLVFDVSERGYIATNTKNGPREEVRILSLRKGRHYRMLDRPEHATRATQLVWREDERGVEFLQGCIGPNVVKWSLDGDDSE